MEYHEGIHRRNIMESKKQNRKKADLSYLKIDQINEVMSIT